MKQKRRTNIVQRPADVYAWIQSPRDQTPGYRTLKNVSRSVENNTFCPLIVFLQRDNKLEVALCPPPAWNGDRSSQPCLRGQDRLGKGSTPTTVAHIYWRGKQARELFPGSSFIKGGLSASIQHCCIPSPAMLKMCHFP